MQSPNTFTLYRFFDAENALLYVGLTVNPGRRMEKHRAERPWWPDVARITMEQYSSIEALRAAEREAIKVEKPLHNIRMNGGTPHPTSDHAPAAEIDGLVGRAFHSWHPRTEQDSEYATVRNGRVLDWQGRIVEQITDDLYLVETYSWMDGSTATTQLISVHEMRDWTFYSNNIEMIAALGCREWRGNPGQERVECGGIAEYLTVSFGLGRSAVCEHCAGYYSEVQPIVWRNGIAELGKKTRVKHPLAGIGGRPS